MEILEKCFFYELDDIIKFKKYTIFDLNLKQSFINHEQVFETGNNNFHISFPSKSNLNHFTHITLKNGTNFEYQEFIIQKLHVMIHGLLLNKSILSKQFELQHLIIIFDIASTWNGVVNNSKNKVTQNMVEIDGNTTIVRISLLQILQLVECKDSSTFLKLLDFFELYLSSPSSMTRFFTDILKLDITKYNLTAIIIDNLSFLNIQEEPQNIELTRKIKLSNSSKLSEKLQTEYNQQLRFMDYLNYIHSTLGTLIITTSFLI